MIVIDASAAVSALVADGPARKALASEALHAPHLIDVEVASTLRRSVGGGRMTASEGEAALKVWRRLGVARYGMTGLVDRVWKLRDNLTAYDATYVALAEALDCALLTADARISRAPDLTCPVTVVPSGEVT